MTQLPNSWYAAPVRELVEMDPKNDCPDDFDVGFVPLARLGNHYGSHHTFETRKWVNIKSGYTHFADGDVMLARITPSFENGKAGIARGLPNGLGAGSTEYIVCRPIAGGLLSKYLLAFFKTPLFLEEGAREMTGAVGHQRVPKRYVLDSLIPLAPINEQRRITEKLDLVMTHLDGCNKSLDRVPSLLKQFRQSVLAAAISGNLTRDWRETSKVAIRSNDLLETMRACHRDFANKLREGSKSTKPDHTRRRRYRVPEAVDLSLLGTLPETWVWGSGGELVEVGHEIVYGIVQPGPKLKKGIPYIRGTDIHDGEILAGQLLRTSPEIASRYSHSTVRGGDVLLGIIRATKVAIVPNSLTGANSTRSTALFRPSTVIRAKFLAIALEAPATQAWLHERYRGIDMPGLNLADVRRVPIPLPPLEEQDEIVRRVKCLFCSERRAFQAYSQVRMCLDRLAPSLFNKVFRGEFVPQDPNDEKSSDVLERIRALRSAQALAGSKKRSTRKRKMPQITPDSLGQIISEIPQEKFTFDELRGHVSGDYNSLRDALFVLLGDSEPILRQVFDDVTQKMVLERTQP